MFKKLSMLILVVLAWTVTGYADQEIQPSSMISGKNKNTVLRSLAPKNGFITDPASFQNLMIAWQPTEKPQLVDFEKEIVLVATVQGPNNMFTNGLNLDIGGDLKYETGSTRMGGPGFGFLVQVVSKTGVKKVNGVAINVAANSVTPAPANNVTLLPPGARRPKPETQAPTRNPDRVTTSLTQTSISVDIVGKIQSGIVAVGGETTGIIIGSNGIVWELDLQNNFRNLTTIRQIGFNLARVQGTLSRVRGIEGPDRMVVSVESIVRVGLPSSNNMSKTGKTNQLDRPPNQAQPPGTNDLTMNKASASKATVRATGFLTITLNTTGGIVGAGQTHRLKPDGTVSVQPKGQSISDSWNLSTERLQQVDQVVLNTDWKSVKRVSRSGAQDVFVYEVLIETPKHTYRFFADGPSIGDQPELAQLLSLMVIRDQDK